jgi:phosphoribosyl-ATP pyrophosphohydrolase
MNKTFEQVATEWIEFAIPTFEKSTALSSAFKAKEEVGELIADLKSEQDGINPMSEYADVVLCIIHSLAKKGFSVQALINWMDIKMKVNKKREWILNPDNTYSHKK